MGAFKPLLTIGGVSAAQLVISAFQDAGLDQVVLVTGNNADELENSLKHMNIVFLRNDLYEHNEMFDSVKIGVGFLKDKCEKIFVTPVDVPLFTADTVRALLKSDADIVIPSYNNKPGHPIIISGRAIQDVLEYSGGGGLRGAIAGLGFEPAYIEVSDNGILFDMDTQDDYVEIIKMSKRVYLVRHGEPEFDGGEKRCIGLTDLPLGERGRRQAADLAAFFSDKYIEAVFHSHLKRSRQTAEIISNKKYPAVEADGLEELDMGEWENLTFSEIRQKYPALYERRGSEMSQTPPPGGESFKEGLTRFSAAVGRISSESKGNIVIVAHAGVNRIFLCDALGLDFDDVLKIAQPYGCINKLSLAGGSVSVESCGIMPKTAPDKDECVYLLKKRRAPDEVISHCVAVSRKAVSIAESLGFGLQIDRELVRSAALLHDIAKTEKDHAKAGAAYLTDCGYPRVANVIRSHHDLASEDFEALTESMLVFYADKLLFGTDEVSLEERFSKSRLKCKTPEALASNDLQYGQALRVQELLNNN